MDSRQKLKYLFQHPDTLEAIQMYDRHQSVCERCYDKLQSADDNSENYYDYYWQNWIHSQSQANKLVKQHNLTLFGRQPITQRPRDDAEDIVSDME